jgi:hypothetical protein
MLYLSAKSLVKNLCARQRQPLDCFMKCLVTKSLNDEKERRYLPPTKCRPLNHATSGFGAVRLTSATGRNPAAGPSAGGPLSTCHPEGASTDSTGLCERTSAAIDVPKGSRIVLPLKENPEYFALVRSGWG